MYPKAACVDSKHKNGAVTATPAATGGPFTLLNGIAQGTDENQRIGNSANIHCIGMCWTFNLPYQLASQINSDSVRIIVVNDKQANSPTNPAGWNAGWVGGGVMELSEMNTVYNFDNVDRYDIIDDFTVDMNRTATGGTTPNLTSGQIRKTVFKTYHGNWETRYSGSTNLINSINSNAIQVIACSQAGLIVCRTSWTVWYHDY